MNGKTNCTLAIAFAILFSSCLWSQSTKQIYAAGVNMGLASFQASIALEEKDNYAHMIAARKLALQFLNNAFTFITCIDTAAGYSSPLLDTNTLKSLIEKQSVVSTSNNYYNSILNPELFEGIIRLIDEYTEKLTENADWSHYLHAYTLGVQMAIAEEQAAIGEPARQIVYISLNTAKVAAQELDLDLTKLNECLILSSGTASMEDIYSRIVSLRNIYQSSL